MLQETTADTQNTVPSYIKAIKKGKRILF